MSKKEKQNEDVYKRQGQVNALGLQTGALAGGQHQGLYIMIHVKVSFVF